jgi:RNA polymerase sigma factor (sigma-70 family)
VAVAARTSEVSRTMPFGLLGDERLARLAAGGHARAFAVVYQRHHQALFRYCRSILRNDADAQDALQSTFAAAFAALGRGRPDAPIRPWLFRIAHNEAVSTLRRRRPTADLSEALDCCTTSVEDQAEERATLDLLLRDLRELNERQRSALVMRELSGLSHEEIALALETSVGAAKQTIYEARQSLFEFAEGRAMLCDEVRRTISDADGRFLRSRRVRAHLRECSACASFSAAIPGRSRELQALVPALPALTAAGLLGRIAGPGSTHGTGTGVASLAAAGAGKTTGAALAANALAGVAVVASATVGVTIGVDSLVLAHAQHPAAAPAARSTPLPASSATAATGITRTSRHGSGQLIGHGARSPRAAGARNASSSATVPLRGAHPGASGRPAHAPSLPSVGVGSSSSAGQPVTARPGRSGWAPGQSGATPGQSGATPGQSGSAPGKSGATPGQSGSVPGQSGATPGPSGSAPGKSGAAPGRSATAGSGRPASAGAGKPVTTTTGNPATASAGKPPWGGSGNVSDGSGSAGSSQAASVAPGRSAASQATTPTLVPPRTPAQPTPAPLTSTRGAAPHGH